MTSRGATPAKIASSKGCTKAGSPLQCANEVLAALIKSGGRRAADPSEKARAAATTIRNKADSRPSAEHIQEAALAAGHAAHAAVRGAARAWAASGTAEEIKKGVKKAELEAAIVVAWLWRKSRAKDRGAPNVISLGDFAERAGVGFDQMAARARAAKAHLVATEPELGDKRAKDRKGYRETKARGGAPLRDPSAAGHNKTVRRKLEARRSHSQLAKRRDIYNGVAPKKKLSIQKGLGSSVDPVSQAEHIAGRKRFRASMSPRDDNGLPKKKKMTFGARKPYKIYLRNNEPRSPTNPDGKFDGKATTYFNSDAAGWAAIRAEEAAEDQRIAAWKKAQK